MYSSVAKFYLFVGVILTSDFLCIVGNYYLQIISLKFAKIKIKSF